MPSLDQLLSLLKEEPDDQFLRYGLAMEYAKQSKFDDSLKTFRDLITLNPDYVAAYFMAGRTCEQAGEPEDAKAFYKGGIDAAKRTGDSHAAGEIAAALMMLE
jgi:tetratricopeptide (TPR) repeat protein